MVDNCCKLRYMKILGGLRAVPEKPNLTKVTTRTTFMTATFVVEDLFDLFVASWHAVSPFSRLLTLGCFSVPLIMGRRPWIRKVASA